MFFFIPPPILGMNFLYYAGEVINHPFQQFCTRPFLLKVPTGFYKLLLGNGSVLIHLTAESLVVIFGIIPLAGGNSPLKNAQVFLHT